MALATEAVVRSEMMPDYLHGESLRIVGDHHSHPDGTVIPSDQDMNAWASNLWKGRALEFVSIILALGRPSGPTFQGWVTRTVERGRYVCEPAEVDDPYGYGST